MMSNEQQQIIFETVQLPVLIRNEKVPSLTLEGPDGSEVVLFRRGPDSFEIHKYLYDILQKHGLWNETIDYFAAETAVKEILLSDDEGIKFTLGLKKPD